MPMPDFRKGNLCEIQAHSLSEKVMGILIFIGSVIITLSVSVG